MARPGPAGKPFELKALEGNRGHRPIDISGVFRPEVGLPSIPKDLSVAARKVWKRLAPELLRYNLMSTVFSDAFEDLCETIADVKMLRRALKAREALMRSQDKPASDAWQADTPNGMPVQHPLVQNLRNTKAEMWRALDKFGLNPSEAASVTACVRAQLKLFENDQPDSPAPAADPGRPALPDDFDGF